MNDFKIAIELAKKEEAKLTIGVQQEKILHRTIKYYLEKDEQYHEIKVGKMFADIKKDNLIYEIQTAHFNSLRHKLDVFLPDYQVKVVYPIAYNKTIHLINSLGEISIRKSPNAPVFSFACIRKRIISNSLAERRTFFLPQISFPDSRSRQVLPNFSSFTCAPCLRRSALTQARSSLESNGFVR